MELVKEPMFETLDNTRVKHELTSHPHIHPHLETAVTIHYTTTLIILNSLQNMVITLVI